MALVDDYKRARKNLLARVNRLKKAGYDVPDDIVPKRVKKPTKKSIEKIKGLTTQEIKKKIAQKSYKQGKTRVKPKKSKAPTPHQKRDNAPRYKSMGDVALKRIYALIQRFLSVPHFSEGANEVGTVIDNLVARFGEDVVGDAILKIEGQGYSLDSEAFYTKNAGVREQYISHLIDAIDEAGDFTKDDINNLLNELGAGYNVE